MDTFGQRWERIVLHMLGVAKLVKCTDQLVERQLRSCIPLLSYDLLETNGQAEATYKSLGMIIKKLLEDSPRKWHKNAVLLVEITVPSLRVAQRHGLSIEDYHWALYGELDQAEEERWTAFEIIRAHKAKVAQWYNKKVKDWSFAIGDLVWKCVLPIGTKDHQKGKWLLSWERPYVISDMLPNGAYRIMHPDGLELKGVVNAGFLKLYHMSFGLLVDRVRVDSEIVLGS
ncbi:uncharacterized protein LOC127242556 [Andrographis paniculata]|uniref:uncharacterized protein LOC127242556 n=1 Tax=Andrographis paniculata TaxID=175694 RepID=UPI0021E85C2C|nr:uncharacterized protein LOC127242556 [Andrographis paniculata]